MKLRIFLWGVRYYIYFTSGRLLNREVRNFPLLSGVVDLLLGQITMLLLQIHLVPLTAVLDAKSDLHGLC